MEHYFLIGLKDLKKKLKAKISKVMSKVVCTWRTRILFTYFVCFVK